MCVVLPFLVLFLGFFHPTQALNQDLGRHILTGNIILSSFSIPSTNLYSYTYPDFPFINHHWLSEVFFSILFAIGGYQAIFASCLLTIILSWGIIFSSAKKHSSWLTLAITSILYLGILFERTDLRPELFSFLFLSLFIAILYRYRENYTKSIFLLIPLELLWVNSHIYFPLGVFVLVLFCLDAVVLKRKSLKQKKPLTLLLVTILTGLVTLCNPHFIAGALYPFHVFQNYGYTIEENQTPFFLQSLGFVKASLPFLEIATILLFLSLILTFKRSRLIDWLLTIAFTYIAFSAVRNFPLFVFTTLPAFTYSFSTIFSSFSKSLTHKHIRFFRFSSCLILIIASLLMIRSLSQKNEFSYGVKEDAWKAVAYFKDNNLPSPIFNNFDIGSYLEFKLYPKINVFIDGRPEAYPASFIQNTYIPMQQDPHIFAEVEKKYGFQTIIFAHNDQTSWAETFSNFITHNQEWKMVYLDPTMVILVKDSSRNKTLLEKIRPSIVDPSTVKHENPLRSLGHFYSITSNKPQLIRSLQALLTIRPYDCTYLQSMLTLIDQSDPSYHVYLQKFQDNCM